MKKGKIKSYNSDKRYGFISGQEGGHYFFHVDDLSNKETPAVGAMVEFEPVATPKGNRAKSVVLIKQLTALVPVDVFTTKNELPKRGKVVASYECQSPYFEDRDEGRNFLLSKLLEASGNALLKLKWERATFSDGNYKYSKFAWFADMAIVAEEKPCFNQKEKENLEQVLACKIEFFNREAPELFKVEPPIVKKSGNGGLKLMLALGLLIVLTFLAGK